MTTLHDKTIILVEKLINASKFSNSEPSLKNTANELTILYTNSQNVIRSEYIQIVANFCKYVSDYDYNLVKLLSLLRNPPTAFPIGSRICHTRICFEDNSSSLNADKVVHEYGIVDDYDYTVNQYQLVYDNGSTVGWIPEKYLNIA